VLRPVVDLRPGGAFELGNRLPDGSEVWIRGAFLEVEPDRRLVYSWRLAPDAPEERVTVDLRPAVGGTLVHVAHVWIPTEQARDGHMGGWQGCLDGLVALLGDAAG
jgi:glutathione S-transferase